MLSLCVSVCVRVCIVIVNPFPLVVLDRGKLPIRRPGQEAKIAGAAGKLFEQ